MLGNAPRRGKQADRAVQGFRRAINELSESIEIRGKVRCGLRRGISAVSENAGPLDERSEEHTSELQSLMRISYAVFCLKKKKTTKHETTQIISTKDNN